VGVSVSEFWEITPRQFQKYIEVYQSKQEQRGKEIDCHNYNLGKYIAMAFHAPRKYPRKPFLAEPEMPRSSVMTGEEMDRAMRRNTILLGGEIR
jgi:hypothetical protein